MLDVLFDARQPQLITCLCSLLLCPPASDNPMSVTVTDSVLCPGAAAAANLLCKLAVQGPQVGCELSTAARLVSPLQLAA